jgi:DNA-binding response OmpR family regulator
VALTLGADDYVGKPFSLEEVVARARAILRRTQARPEATSTLRYHDLTMDEDAHEVRRGDRLVHLTPTEYNLLHYLLLNAGKVVSKAHPRPRVALRLRRRLERGGDVRQLSAEEDRQRHRARADPHGARLRLAIRLQER